MATLGASKRIGETSATEVSVDVRASRAVISSSPGTPQAAVVVSDTGIRSGIGTLHLRELLDRCLWLVQQQTALWDVPVSLEAVPRHALVVSDGKRLERVVNGLLYNAVHLAGRDSKTGVSVRMPAGGGSLEFLADVSEAGDLWGPIKRSSGRYSRMASGDGLSVGSLMKNVNELGAQLIAESEPGCAVFRLVLAAR